MIVEDTALKLSEMDVVHDEMEEDSVQMSASSENRVRGIRGGRDAGGSWILTQRVKEELNDTNDVSVCAVGPVIMCP